jgi:uncharacterized membrane protein
MTRYEILLFLHISAAIIWIGAGFLLNVQGARADLRGDQEGIRRALEDAGGLANVLFIPAAVAAFVTGLLLVFDGPWSFDQLWIVLGLAGFAATFATGLFMLKPRSEKLAAIIERDGGLSPEALVGARQLMILGRTDYVVLFLVVADIGAQADERRRRHARRHGGDPRRGRRLRGHQGALGRHWGTDSVTA